MEVDTGHHVHESVRRLSLPAGWASLSLQAGKERFNPCFDGSKGWNGLMTLLSFSRHMLHRLSLRVVWMLCPWRRGVLQRCITTMGWSLLRSQMCGTETPHTRANVPACVRRGMLRDVLSCLISACSRSVEFAPDCQADTR